MAAQDFLTVDHFSLRDLARIFSRIEVSPTGCWQWLGRDKTTNGYGRLRHQNRMELVHRVMYAWLVGPIPRGIGRHIPQLDHRECDNPSCCNPAHLRLVSGRENSLRSRPNPIQANAKKTHCVRGHELPAAPNDRSGRKRYCVTCSRDMSARRREDPAYREMMREYLRAYQRERWRGPMVDVLRARAREAAQRARDRRKHA